MSRIRADQLVNRAGSGGPKFPHGVAEGFSVSGVVTATSYRGDGSQLTGIDASSLKDGSNVKVQAVSGGANVTGNVAATGNVTAVDGTFSGNLTVNGTTTTIDTAVTSVDSLSVDGNVGIGTTNPTQLLHLSKSSASQILLERTGSNPSQIAIKNEGELLQITQNTDGIIFKTGSSPAERLRITSAGDVQIGTSANAAGNLRYLDVANYNTGGSAGSILRLLTVKNDGSSSTSADIVKYKAGGLVINNNEAIGTTGYISFGTATAGGSTTERLRITSDGHILPGADNTQDLGSSTKRFANIYTGDLNLSNEGSANDVDGTWGQYTIQEGEDDLFLINRRTGKKYKFNLTEVN